MWQLIFGIFLIALGGVSVWFGGHLASDGWKKLHSPVSSITENHDQEHEDIFRVSIINVMRFKFPGPLLYFYNSKFGKTISPVSIALYVEASNNKQIISRIYSYTVKILFRYDEGGELLITEDGKGGRNINYKPSGNVVEKWHLLHSLGMLHDQVYWVKDNDWSQCKRLDFSNNSFDVLARDKQMQPGESIMGWIFLELPPDLRGQLPEILEIELTFKNSQGETITIKKEAPKPDSSSSVISSGAWHFLEGYYDLAKENYTMCPQVDLHAILKEEKKKSKKTTNNEKI
jgi:hypothetical protein